MPMSVYVYSLYKLKNYWTNFYKNLQDLFVEISKNYQESSLNIYQELYYPVFQSAAANTSLSRLVIDIYDLFISGVSSK